MSFVQELKRRNVFRVAVAYVVAAWVIMQFSALILDIYQSPDWVIKIIVALLGLGLPFALFFAWAFEATPEGIKRESEVDRSHSSTDLSTRRLDLLTIGMVVLAIALFSIDRFLTDEYPDVPDSSVSAADTDQGIVWATQQLLEIDRLRDLGQFDSAFALATEVSPLLAKGTLGEDFWDGFSWSANIETDPPGARAYRQAVYAIDDEWEDLGLTPLASVRFAEGKGYRIRFELEGHRQVNVLQSSLRKSIEPGAEETRPIKLDPVDVLPEEMVRIRGFAHNLVDYDDFFMDRFEVTNRDFEQFVVSGGYEKSEYWSQVFIRDGTEIPRQQAVAEFVDRTGRPGPSSWVGGVYADGEDDYPVNGVSWYEAAAYAKFVDKELPTAAHHARAQSSYFVDAGLIVPLSNLGGEGPRPVGENQAMTTMGVYDLIGNVREWCWNETGPDKRCTAGAAWTDASFLSFEIIPKSPWDRDLSNGFRLIRTFDSEEKLARLRQPTADELPVRRNDWNEARISDEAFNIYRRMYAYDPLPLNAEVVEVVEFEHWTRERVEFDLPYQERGGAYLFVPKQMEGPFETVIFWSGVSLLNFRSVDEFSLESFRFIMRSGRVVVAPIFKGTVDQNQTSTPTTYNRVWGDKLYETGSNWRNYQIMWVQDLSRTIDYLETRDDINSEELGYYGLSWGAYVGPIVLAVEDRIDAAVFNAGGLGPVGMHFPEADSNTFITHVHDPVLMINGEYDIVFPLETAQKPMFELLGTDPAHKKHVVSPAGHLAPRDVVVRETLEWFDLYLSEQGN